MTLTPVRRDRLLFVYALFISAAVLFFCSKSSPGYPINDWADANIYFSIGKGMTQGQVVYRDLYDHKGPLLYALHALCALISFDSFTGVWLMEVLLAGGFLFFAHKLLQLFGARRSAWIALPVLALLVYSAYSFAEGDSAEELCMLPVMWSLWHVLGHFDRGDARMSRRGLLLEGVLAGCVFWIKFTIIGMHAGLLAALVIAALLRRSLCDALYTLGWLAAGFALSTLPWIIYFGLNGAIVPWLKTYLYDNLFLYGSDGGGLVSRLRAMASCGLEWLVSNIRYTPFIVLGLAWALMRNRRMAGALCAAAALGAVAVFIGGKTYPYYGQALAPLAAVGFIPLCHLCDSLLDHFGKKVLVACCGAACILCVALCPLVSHNMRADYGAPFGSPRGDTMQYRLAQHIPANASLLNYGFMDAGFFTASGTVPKVLYFHRCNVPIDEMIAQQRRYIDEGVCDYVITRGYAEPESLQTLYELVDTAPTPNFWYDTVYLYRKK